MPRIRERVLKRLNLFFVFCFLFFSAQSVSAEILYNDRKDLLQDQTNISDKELKKENSSRSIYLMALRTMEEKKEYAKDDLLKLKKRGVLDAEYSLFVYRDYFNIPQGTALKFLEDAAQKGHAISQEEISDLYRNGIYYIANPSAAQIWMEKSATLGNSYAMRKTAKNYFLGYGKNRDDTKGYEWLQKFYNKLGRNFDDWDLLAKVYETGRGTPVDLVKAYMCYDLEGTAGIDEKARIAPKMTAEQRAEGLRLSREWQEKNHVYTMQSLGLSRQSDGSYR